MTESEHSSLVARAISSSAAVAEPADPGAAQVLGARRQRTALRFVRRNAVGVAAGAGLIVITLIAIFAPVIAPYDPKEFLSVGPFALPSSEAWLGTDQIGRDLFTRLIYGARTSLTIAVTATTVGIGAGSLLGLLSAYAGGWFDLLIQRVVDMTDAFPALVLAILLVALMGASSWNVTIAIALVMIPGTNRVARSLALGMRELTYVEAARSVGAHPGRLIFRHMAPGLIAPMTILAAGALGSTIITESSLSFLGLGPPPPNPSWGQMLSGDIRQYFITHPWLAIVPGAALSITILCTALVGDALRDALDPRLRRR